MLVCTLFVWFVVYGVLGWVYESTYCTIVERTWKNRGFLYGPICPIYGVGIVTMMLIWGSIQASGQTLTWWQVFLIAFFGSMVLEYTTHWALEKLFHAYWWDYSNMPLNINGRICLPASIAFGLGGLLVAYVLYQPTIDISQQIDPLVIEALSLVLMALTAADTAITVSALNRFAHAASALNTSVNAHMDQFVANVQERGAAVAGQLQEKRDDAAQAIAGTVEAIKATGANVTEQLQERGSAAADAVAHERDRFTKSLRDLFLADMGHLAREALRRVHGFTTSKQLTDALDVEALGEMLDDVQHKHWPHD